MPSRTTSKDRTEIRSLVSLGSFRTLWLLMTLVVIVVPLQTMRFWMQMSLPANTAVTSFELPVTTPVQVLSNNASSEMSYSQSLMTLKCLTTPGCFPSLHCRKGKPQRIGRRLKWEEQAFCVEDLKERQGNCLVYSFGIHTSWEWEAKVARLFGCEVHAFDPTMNHPTNLAPGVTFHKLGLQATGTDMSATHSEQYDAIDPDRLFPLDILMNRLNHTHLDVLMMDCEGCEWGVLHQMLCRGGGNDIPVDQFVMELHFQKNLGLYDERDVRLAAEAVVCLEQARFGVVSMETSGCGGLDVDFAKDVVKVIHGVLGSFLLNVALRRIPPTESTVAELVDEMIEVAKEKNANCTGVDCPQVQHLTSKMYGLIDKARQVQHERVLFDTHPTLNESTWKYPPNKTV